MHTEFYNFFLQTFYTEHLYYTIYIFNNYTEMVLDYPL